MDHEEAMDVFWHLSAHIKGECVEMLYQAHVVHGPSQGNPNLDQLQKLYGISFKSCKELMEWKTFCEEAEIQSHRVIERHQQLFMFNDLSPKSAFFLPHGTHIYNRLVWFLRKIYWKRNYKVITPNHYDDNMFSFKVDNEMLSMKPMNCLLHCLIFKSRMRLWREVPLKIADFGALHRNEFSGALHGLTRVWRFAQYDAHIFCILNQLK
ncbi:hypothetical protein A3Q56_08222, partial [Intoshia linei]